MGVNSVLNRLFDLVVTIFLISLLFWVFPVVWCIVRFTSEGNPIYKQTRVGKNQKNFDCFKFRTMRVGTPERGTHETSCDALTSVGSFLRKTKLDELPQLYNVLSGDMSLVGPRPCLPMQKDVVCSRVEKNVFSVKPGITGLAQVRGIDMSTPVILAAVDAEYIKIASLGSNMKILLSTFFGRGIGDNVKDPVKCNSSPRIAEEPPTSMTDVE